MVLSTHVWHAIIKNVIVVTERLSFKLVDDLKVHNYCLVFVKL